MKTTLKNQLLRMKNISAQLWNDESAQGATEYILLLAIVVGLALMFGDKIKGIISSKMESISGAVAGFKPESGN